MADEEKIEGCLVDCVSAIGAVRCTVPGMNFEEAAEALIEDGNIQVINKDHNRRAVFFRAMMIAFVEIVPDSAIKGRPGLIIPNKGFN